MEYQQASEVRKNFSSVIDSAVHERPQFIKRTHDRAVLLSSDVIRNMTESLTIEYNVQKDTDGSFLITNNIFSDIIATGASMDAAFDNFLCQIKEYAFEFYDNFFLYAAAPNRRSHIPYVMRILVGASGEDLGGMLVCQNGGTQ